MVVFCRSKSHITVIYISCCCCNSTLNLTKYFFRTSPGRGPDGELFNLKSNATYRDLDDSDLESLSINLSIMRMTHHPINLNRPF